ncbi:hypothetical protein WS71_02910 [Burkholderia mayonis]|uniref:Uncharacterized protein n=1 Tax=Burkholderia mayonis TaxID=1385591 RepID=A0A1B4FRU3_9BURK|nr:hypothetical protein WS71_02910 [Burkholderia mayonis]KVE51665.1 hypothetical protein WS71_11535 [Burkholderia mayonis]
MRGAAVSHGAARYSRLAISQRDGAEAAAGAEAIAIAIADTNAAKLGSAAPRAPMRAKPRQCATTPIGTRPTRAVYSALPVRASSSVMKPIAFARKARSMQRDANGGIDASPRRRSRIAARTRCRAARSSGMSR